MATESVKINGSTYDVPVEVAIYLQCQKDTIKELLRLHEKQNDDWTKTLDITTKRHNKQIQEWDRFF